MNSDGVPVRRIKVDMHVLEPNSDIMRMAQIHRISEEQEVSLAEAEIILDNLLDKISKAIKKS